MRSVTLKNCEWDCDCEWQHWFVFNVNSVYCTVFLCISDRICSFLHNVVCVLRLLKLFCCRYPFFVGIRGNVTHFRAWGNTAHFQNELKETLITTTRFDALRLPFDCKSTGLRYDHSTTYVTTIDLPECGLLHCGLNK